MRVAILHDFLNQYGGAERVLEVFLNMFPEADLYTLLYDPARTGGQFEGRVTKTSVLDFPFVRSHHRAFIPLLPWASSSLSSATTYDLVISSTASYAKGFGVEGRCHVAYCYTPLRYAWEREYVDAIPFLPGFVKRAAAPAMARLLQRWDYRAAQRPNVFIAISNHIAAKIRAYYERDAVVIYPPVNTDRFFPEPTGPARTTLRSGGERGRYLLMVGRLLHYKRFDIGIRVAEELRMPLTIVGQGPDGARLRSLSHSPLIEFISDASDSALRLLYSNAQCLLFPQVEDFGLVAAEALACGTPVVAYARGGGGEIVSDGRTGVLVEDQTVDAFVAGVRRAARTPFERARLRARAEEFSVPRFTESFLRAVHAAGVPALDDGERSPRRRPSHARRR